MTPEQKQLIREKWKHEVTKNYAILHGFVPAQNSIADFFIDLYEPITKETERVTEDRVVNFIDKLDVERYARNKTNMPSIKNLKEDIINFIRNK